MMLLQYLWETDQTFISGETTLGASSSKIKKNPPAFDSFKDSITRPATPTESYCGSDSQIPKIVDSFEDFVTRHATPSDGQGERGTSQPDASPTMVDESDSERPLSLSQPDDALLSSPVVYHNGEVIINLVPQP